MFRITKDPSSGSHILRICCRNTDYVHVKGHDRTINVILAKYCKGLTDNGSFAIRNRSEHF